MANPAFSVSVADLKRGPIRVSWTLKQDWLRGALRDTEATPSGDGDIEVELSANGAEVVVRGQAHVAVTMPCSKTLDPVDVAVSPDIFLLLVPAPPAGAGARGGRGGKAGRRRRSADRPRGGSQAKRKGAPGGWGEDPPLPPEEAAQDTYDGEQIILDRFIREFIVLELPMTVTRPDLRLTEDAAIAPSPSEDSVPQAEQPLDPRLAPLAEIASRLRQDKE